MKPSNSGPYYRQILLEIHSKIRQGEWNEGDRIPSEKDLCNQFGVSRITVRQAIRLATNSGILETHPGKGTFVIKTRSGKGIIENISFSELIRRLGKEPKSRILGRNTVSPLTRNYPLTKLFETQNLINLIILGLGDQEPLIIYSSFFPYQLGVKMARKAKEKVSKGIPFSSVDLYHDGDIGVFPHTAHQTYEAIQATGKTAEILKIVPKSPLFLVKSVFYASDDTPIEYREAKYRGDMFMFHVTREFLWP